MMVSIHLFHYVRDILPFCGVGPSNDVKVIFLMVFPKGMEL